MKTEYKHIEFSKMTHERHKRPWFLILNKKSGDELGQVEYYPTWRQYVFMPYKEWDCVFSASCLADIQEFLGALKEAWMHKKAKERAHG